MDSYFEAEANLGTDSDFETPPALLELRESATANRELLMDDVEALIDGDSDNDDTPARELREDAV